MNSWWFRMKPRSILRTIEWFPSFAKLEKQDWNKRSYKHISKKTNKQVYITRRKYIYYAHGDDYDMDLEDLISGRYDTGDVESNARNDKISFEFFGFGYVDSNNLVRVTDVGRLIVEERMNSEYLLKQLLKIQFPSPIIRKKHDDGHVFAMEILLAVFKNFDYITPIEMAFLFGCMDIEDINVVIDSIEQFRTEYKSLENKLNNKKVIEIYESILKSNYPNLENKPTTYLDYSDAFIRALGYTGLFVTRGRGIYTKLYVPEHSKMKVKLLQEKHKFVYNEEEDLELYMEYFGDPYNIILPWDNVEDRKIIVDEKLEKYRKIIDFAQEDDNELEITDINKIEELISNEKYDSLVMADEQLSESLLSINEKIFIKSTSKTDTVRNEILEKFEDINSGNEDMAALWLEVNTWKSIVAINGDHKTKRNFKLEEDLTPKSFAPGAGNTPDMEVYVNGCILIPEVSLMSGVQQWEHEGSSVIDHVLKFIKKYGKKDVFGIFISKSMNIRTIWQFFILNKESWIGRTVPVIPITIDQYINILKFIYEKDLNIHDFSKLIYLINENALEVDNYNDWNNNIDCIIIEWKKIYES